MSYFGQVRQDPSSSLESSSRDPRQKSDVPVGMGMDVDVDADAGMALGQGSRSQKTADTGSPASGHHASAAGMPQSSLSVQTTAPDSLPSKSVPSQPPLPSSSRPPSALALKSGPAPQIITSSVPYPTPPPSHPCSSSSSQGPDRTGYPWQDEASGPAAPAPKASAPGNDVAQKQPVAEKASPATSLTSRAQLQSQLGAGTSRPASSHKPNNSVTPNTSDTPGLSGPPSSGASEQANKWFSLGGLKELTRGFIFKSGPPTPTRALSATNSVHSERDAAGRTSNDGAEPASGTQTPRSTGAQAPAPKGKLTIKITEARGLRKCRDPYVVAVFQRSELISGGPRQMDDDDNMTSTPTTIGSIPIQRQGSDSGRPPMAIPMRSRQSSNTSIHDYNTFRNRSARIQHTNPKWDAEAVLYVASPSPPHLLAVY